jgi:hypothetical protein
MCVCRCSQSQLLSVGSAGKVVDVFPSFSAFDRVFPPADGSLPFDSFDPAVAKPIQVLSLTVDCPNVTLIVSTVPILFAAHCFLTTQPTLA